MQNLATKKILGVFKTAPIILLELEAALPPLNIRLNHTSRRYILRALKLSKKHPIRLEVEKVITGVEEEYDLIGNLPKSNTTILSLVFLIFHIINLNTLEVIRHFYFPLWKKEVLYTINISKLLKEDEAKAHL